MVAPLLKINLTQVIKHPRLCVLFAVFFFVMAVFVNLFTTEFLNLQASNTENLSVSGKIFAPVGSIALLVLLIVLPLIGALLHPSRVANGTFRLLQSYPYPQHKHFINDWLMMLMVVLMFLCGLFVVHLPVLLSTQSDLPNYFVHMGGLALASMAFTSLLTVIQRFCPSPMTAIIGGYCLVFVIWLIPLLLRQWPDTLVFLDAVNVLGWFGNIRLGLVYNADIAAFTLLIATGIFSGVAVLMIPKARLHQRLIGAVIILLVLILSRLISGAHDVSSNQRFSLMPLLAETLSEHSQTLTITSYGLDDFAENEANLRIISPLINHFPNIKYQKRLNAKINADQQSIGIEFRLNDQAFWLPYPFSDHPQRQLLKTMMTLKAREQSFIGFVEGHSEARIDKQNQRHLSKIAEELRRRGFLLTQFSLAQLAAVPDNIKLLVIASPRDAWGPEKTNAIIDYVGRGGHLLWLRDPEDTNIVELENLLSVQKISGTLMDSVGFQQGTPHPAVLLIKDFSDHAISNNLSSLVALPWSAGLSIAGSHWQTTQLLITHPRVWTEWEPDSEQLSFDEALGELQGSFPLLIALQRQQGKQLQRVIVTGDSHFLADMALNNYDNKQLALNIFHWLTQSDLAQLPTLNTASDNQLTLTRTTGYFIGWINPFLIPAVCLLLGFILWRRAKN